MPNKRRSDPETRRLIGDLLARAGMMMEDASLTALLGDTLDGSLHDRICELENSAASITAVVRAAKVLLEG